MHQYSWTFAIRGSQRLAKVVNLKHSTNLALEFPACFRSAFVQRAFILIRVFLVLFAREQMDLFLLKVDKYTFNNCSKDHG